MRPKPHRSNHNQELFRSRLDQIINMKHVLVLLADKVDWHWLEEEIAPFFKEKGRAATSGRFMLGLLLLKAVYNLSDEQVCEQWLQNPYFQYFTGEAFFQHDFPHDRSSMTRWRQLLGDKVEILLSESLRLAHSEGALETKDIKRVSVDTTVQEKNAAFPTDAKLLYTGICQLGSAAKTAGLALRQSYVRVGKRASIMAGRYAHAKQHKRKHKQLKFLRTRLKRLVKEIACKDALVSKTPALQARLDRHWQRAYQLLQELEGKATRSIYSWHAPEVECIGKGKARSPYEFGVKASFVTTNAKAKGGMFILDAAALPGRPFDGHTLKAALQRTQARTGCQIERVYADKGYRGHAITVKKGGARIFLSGQIRGVHGQIKKELKRRSAIEPVIGHMKNEGRLGRNFLKGRLGDRVNVLMAAIGYNFKAIMRWLKLLFAFILSWLHHDIFHIIALKPKAALINP